MKKAILHILLITFLTSCVVNKKDVQATSQFVNFGKQELPDIITKLISQMTLEEKIGQLILFTSNWDVTGAAQRDNYIEDIKAGKVGALFSATSAQLTHTLQKIAVEETRLGIPLLFGYDVIHGYRTIFPIPLGESCSWDLEAIEKSARIAAIESTAAGLHWTFAPMVDIARDPRWGRISEGAGEDTYLGVQIAKARIRGFQGKNLSDNNTIVACTKHFAAYGAAQAGRDYHTVDISERVLRETYLPPFKATLDEGAKTIMTSFNELNGIPATANKFLLTKILREEWDFDGFVVSDYTSINEMVNHGTAVDDKDAGRQAILAGLDMDMQGTVFYNHLKTLYDEGKVSMEVIDQAVTRILKIKHELGLFDDPYKYCNETREKNTLLDSHHLEAARDIARKSMVLLENKNHTLPFSKNVKSIAVIGSLANSKNDMLGSWSAKGIAEECVSVLDGIESHFSKQVNIHFSKGYDKLSEKINAEELENAISIVKKSEIVVLVLGEQRWQSGEAASRTNIGLPQIQLDLAKNIIKMGKPVAVVLMNGRPLTIPWLAENAPAVLETWYSGTQGGHAVADILFGDYNPSGKLVTTFPRSVGQIPIFYNMNRTGRPYDINSKYTSKYLDCKNTPLYPFGYGLSYTQFEYSDLSIDKKHFSKNEKIMVSCTLKNVGKMDGEEVVQLYIKDLFSSTTRPERELKAFRKIMVKAGSFETIRFELSEKDFSFLSTDMVFRAEEGDFEIYVGGNSDASKMVKVNLMELTR